MGLLVNSADTLTTAWGHNTSDSDDSDDSDHQSLVGDFSAFTHYAHMSSLNRNIRFKKNINGYLNYLSIFTFSLNVEQISLINQLQI